MKRKLLLAVATLLLSAFSGVGGSSLKAQSWTDGATVATGDYYLYNIGGDRFLNRGGTWSTHAVADGQGVAITLASPSEGVYTIYTGVNSKYLGAGCYTDESASNWTFESVTVDGYTNAYKLKASDDKYLYWTGGGGGSWGNEVLSDAKITEGLENNFYWLLIPKATRQDWSAATIAAPAEITYKITNPDFEYQLRDKPSENTDDDHRPWTPDGGRITEGWTTGGFWRQNSSQTFTNGIFFEKWSGDGLTTADAIYQSVTLPAGYYRLSATAHARCTQAYLYAGDDVEAHITDAGTYTTNFYVDAEKAVQLGVKIKDDGTGDWVAFDNTRLYYLGSLLQDDAASFTSGSSMTADKWYKYVVETESEYTITAGSDLANITYTTNGIQATEEATASSNFTSGMTLPVGTYYFKSSETQTLELIPLVKTYLVGAPTTSPDTGDYVQSLTTVTFDFTSSAVTNDEGATFALLNNSATASLTQGGSPVATGELSLVGKVLTATFSAVSLDPATTYTVSLPAEVVGYSGHTTNEAVNITLNTPEVFDGFYYVKSGDLYLSRGANYATQAKVDVYGLPVKLETSATGLTNIIFIDSWFKLFDADNGSLYTDNNHDVDFLLEATEGGYYIVNKNTTTNSTLDGKLYIDSDNGNRVKVSTTKSSVWTFVPCSDASHKVRHQALKDAQAAAVATTASIDAASQSALAEALNTNYNANAVDITGTDGTTKESYQQGAGNTTDAKLEIFKETVDGLTPGLYKLTVKAFERITWANDVYNAGGAAGLTYLYANDEKVQLASLFDYPSATAWVNADRCQHLGDNYYPDRTDAAQAAFDAGNYENVVYVWVTDEGEGTGSITFGINKPHRYGNDGSRGAWICYNNFTLTRYDQTAATMAVNSTAKYGTFCAPFAVTIPVGVTAYSVTGVTGNSLDLEEVSTTIPANKPVVLYAKDGLDATTFYGKSVAGTPTNGLLTGVYESTAAPVGSYVLQYNNSKVGFYQVDDVIPTVGANRCYMTIPSNAKAFFFPGDDEATLIEGLDALTAGEYEAIYTMGGVKVNALQKGTNIVQLKSGKTLKINVK